MNFSRFDRKEIIGKGISGYAQLCKSKSGVYVIKTYHEKESYESKLEYQERVLHEYRVLQQLDHCNIIKVYKYEVSLLGGTVKIYMEAGGARVMEVVTKTEPRNLLVSRQNKQSENTGVRKLDQPNRNIKSLTDVINQDTENSSEQPLDVTPVYNLTQEQHIQPLNPIDLLESLVLCFFKQICSGIEYLHSNGICHRDLKLDNLVVTPSGIIKIIDFATAFHTGPEKPLAIGLVGSAAYCAPETFSSLKYDGKAVDIWSLGIILYILVFRKPPWKSAHSSDPLYSNFLSDPSPLHMLLATSITTSTTFTSHILEPNPSSRCTIADFFSDPWFNSIELCSDSSRCSYHSRL